MAADLQFDFAPATDSAGTEAFIEPLLDLEPEFYSSLCANRDEARRLVRAALEMQASDLGGSEILSVDGQPAALLVRFPCSELMFRQLATLKLAVSLFGPLSGRQKEFIQAWGQGVPPVPMRDVYISKFLVRDALRGRGLGERLLKLAVASASVTTAQFVLHVRRENLGASAFYERNGFETVSHGNTHNLLRRRIGD